MEIGIYGLLESEYDLVLKGLKNKKKIINVVNSKRNVFFTKTVNKEIKYIFKNNDKDVKEKLKDINIDINRNISELSTSEKIMFKIILCIYSGDIIVLKDIFFLLDKNNTKTLYSILKEFKDSKLLIICDDINIIYNYSDKIGLNGNVYNTKELLTDIPYLIENSIEIPYLPMITYLAKKNKNIKLFYHDDVRDIIKDIYKHV